MSIISIDPGTSNTGIVYMDERRIICCKSLTYKSTVKIDQAALMERAENIAKQIIDFAADKPHECIVIEGFVPYQERQNAHTFQTPYLCGYLHSALAGESLVIQTSDKVFNPKRRGNLKHLKEQMAQGYQVWGDSAKCTNDHLRSAAVHGIYYYTRKR
jgi:Holliday junction resolvasome RuvABC endonuclease subunit